MIAEQRTNDSCAHVNSAAELPELLTIAQVAELGRVCTCTVYNLLADGQIKGVKIRNAWRINRDSVLSAFGLD